MGEHYSRLADESGRELNKSTHHKRARKNLKEKCRICGGREKLEVHHKDGNFANDDKENHDTLCQWCHKVVQGDLRAEQAKKIVGF